jgi:hypothetical protein
MPLMKDMVKECQSWTQFFKSTSNKRKLQEPDGDHETTITKKKGKIREGQT